jgi:MoxR-like ATPase
MEKTIDAEVVSEKVNSLIDNIKKVIFVDRKKLEYILASKIAGGHVILADTHGVGKTSLARALAGSIDNKKSTKTSGSISVEPFSRIQCTVDLLPQDIIGFSRLDLTKESINDNDFIFNKGPIFSNFVLCDEINLLTPKTQGSFFQAMEEQKVTIEGKTFDLPSPFFIIATMNLEGAHLFPLPAPQLDRFMIKLSMGIPDSEDECGIVRQHGRSDGWENLSPVITADELISWQEMVDQVTIHDELIRYIVSCVRLTRENPYIKQGASPRAGVKLSRLSRSLSLLRGENYVSPDILKELFIPTISHRIVMHENSASAEEVLNDILESVKIEI